MSEALSIVVVRSFGPESNARIAALDPRLRVTDVSGFIRSEPGSLKPIVPPWEALLATGKPEDARDAAELREHFAEADVMLGMVVLRDFARYAPRLKWIQLVSAGVDYLPDTGLLETGITLTSARGCFDTPIAEWVLAAMLIHAKGSLRCLLNKENRRWERFTPSQLQGKTLGIIGLGSVGSEVARHTRGLSMKAIAYDPYVPAAHAVSLGVGLATIDDLLASSDYIVVTLPLTPETNRLIGRNQFSAMKPTACFINVSRGAIVDEQALVDALRAGAIGAAALDVYEKEPLPADSPLWDMPNVYLTPHIAGGSDHHGQRVTDFFGENLRKFLSGQPLANTIDKKRGY